MNTDKNKRQAVFIFVQILLKGLTILQALLPCFGLNPGKTSLVYHDSGKPAQKICLNLDGYFCAV